ncbi:uncharacterized protein LOC109838261 [Asparagus officinalis]|uniref:uncharacterized protein LOC109838261 n=1 Tax=Asparagus officinalis TaxID=4686 RepID=UPI00098DEF71|nr:uncharacterized protein LOC109838261 [Asparagus officinalis]
MQEEMGSLHRNDTWELVELQNGWKAIGYKWVYTKKEGIEGILVRFKSRLVVKGYYGLELDQLGVKITFLYGDLDEKIYMTQSLGFQATEKEKSAIDRLKIQLSNEFEMKDLGEAKRILGMEISRGRDKERICLTHVIVEDRELMSETPYASIVRSLMYTTVCTRPNLSQLDTSGGQLCIGYVD